MQAKDVELRSVSKRFGAVVAIRPLDLRVESGEFLTLLGPSGCGKTTLLRLIAGLEAVTGGSVHVGGVDVTESPPHRRDTSIMFQDYALFPHKTLLENVAYGLKMRKAGKSHRETGAREWLARMGLAELEGRLPHQLSGGQRQRVALARSLIISPGVLLLDEPLGALDANLRKQLQKELRRLHKEVGLTFIYVTHDQEEAITMSDRIAVMNKGSIEQLGTPQSIYDDPDTEFVARFIGHCNIVSANVLQISEGITLCEAGALGQLNFSSTPQMRKGQRVMLALRPEAIDLSRHGGAEAGNRAELRAVEVHFTGSAYALSLEAADGRHLEMELSRKEAAGRLPAPGDTITVQWANDALKPLRSGPG